MPAFKVTQKGVEALIAKTHRKRTDYFDSTHKGLCLTVGPRGGVWYYFRRIDGKLTRIRLGAWPVLGIKAAREEAGRVEEQVAAGKHPKAEQARQRTAKTEARTQDQGRMVERLARDWREHHFGTLAESTRRDYERLLSEFVEFFSGRDAAEIKRGELVRFLDNVVKRSSAQGNRAAVIIRQIYAYTRDRFDLPANPAADIKNPGKTKRRKRTLDRQEIRVLWRACELAGYPYGHALRMALCTGQRIGEIGSMRWQDIEGDYWRNSKNKTDQRIDVFLAEHARTVLNDSPEIGEYVFSATGKKGIRADTWCGDSGALERHILPRIEQAAEQIDAKPITEHFTPHDLRRTVRTGLTGWAGVLPDTAERVLNHAIGGVRAVYDHADYRPHIADALQRWNAELGRILDGKQASVTPIQREMSA